MIPFVRDKPLLSATDAKAPVVQQEEVPTLGEKYVPASKQPKVVIKGVDMPDHMQRDAVEIAVSVCITKKHLAVYRCSTL